MPVFFFANDAQARITVTGLCEVGGIIEHAIVAASPQMLHLARRLPKQFDNTILSVRECRQDSRAAFVKSLASLARTYERLQVLPIGNMPTRWCLELKQELTQLGIDVRFGDLDSHRRLDSKLEAQRLAVVAGFEPVRRRPIPPQQTHLPFVVKPNNPEIVGAGFRRPILVRTERELRELQASGIEWRQMYVEEYLDGESLYLCCYLEDGVMRDSYIQRNLWQAQAGGSIISAEIVDPSQSLLELGSRFFASTNWTGPAMIEVCENPSGLKFIECNPRYWGPIDIGSRNGHRYFCRQLGVQFAPCPIDSPTRYFNISVAFNAVLLRALRGQRYTLVASGWSKRFESYRDPLVRWRFLRFFLFTLLKSLRKRVESVVRGLRRVRSRTD